MPSSRSVRKIRIAISPRFATRTLEKGGISGVFSPAVTLADQLTVARAAAVPLVVVLYVWGFHGHDYWATALFGGGLERFGRDLGARSRACADVDLGDRLRQARAAPAPGRRLDHTAAGALRTRLDALEQAGEPPHALVRARAPGREEGERLPK